MPQPPKPQFTWKRLRRTHCKRCKVKLTRRNCFRYTDKRLGRIYFNSYCKKCCTAKYHQWKKKHPRKYRETQRRADLKRYYGKTPQWFHQKFAEQGKACAICGTRKFGSKGPCLDHDHQTKQTRGIICVRCNTGLAALEAIPDWAAKAEAYLAKYR
jgi:hypothetical protein